MKTYIFGKDQTVTRRVHTNSDESVSWSIEEKLDDTLKYCAERRRDSPRRFAAAMSPVAEIPISVYEKALIEGWANDPEAWRKWANDPDNKALRLTEGRL